MINPGMPATASTRTVGQPVSTDAPDDAPQTPATTGAPLTPGQIAVQEGKEAQRLAWAAWAKVEAAARMEKAEEDTWKLVRARTERLQHQARTEEKEAAAAAPRRPVKHSRFG